MEMGQQQKHSPHARPMWNGSGEVVIKLEDAAKDVHKPTVHITRAAHKIRPMDWTLSPKAYRSGARSKRVSALNHVAEK